MLRYDASRTRPLSRTRGDSLRDFQGVSVTRWAAARVSACCSRRSMLKSSARIGSSESGLERREESFVLTNSLTGGSGLRNALVLAGVREIRGYKKHHELH